MFILKLLKYLAFEIKIKTKTGLNQSRLWKKQNFISIAGGVTVFAKMKMSQNISGGPNISFWDLY